MEKNNFRIISNKEELESVMYVKSRALKISFGGRHLVLERIYLDGGKSEFVVSENEDVLGTFKTLTEAKSFTSETLQWIELAVDEKVVEEIEPEITEVTSKEISADIIFDVPDVVEEQVFNRKEKRRIKKGLRRIRKENQKEERSILQKRRKRTKKEFRRFKRSMRIIKRHEKHKNEIRRYKTARIFKTTLNVLVGLLILSVALSILFLLNR
jgi:Fe2+ transport system protein B